MKHKLLLLFIIHLAASACAFSQVKFTAGPEIGISADGLPYKEVTAKDRLTYPEVNTRTETRMPVYSPLLGFWAKADIGKHFYLSPGIQYQWVGYRYYEHTDGHDVINMESYTYDKYRKQTFQKLSAPLAIGYNFKILKVKCNLYLGYRINFFMSGVDYYFDTLVVNENHLKNSGHEEKLDPFEKKDHYVTARRWTRGYFAGIGINVTEDINMNASFSTDWTQLYYGNIRFEESFETYRGNIFNLSMKYCIRKKKAESTDNPVK